MLQHYDIGAISCPSGGPPEGKALKGFSCIGWPDRGKEGHQWFDSNICIPSRHAQRQMLESPKPLADYLILVDLLILTFDRESSLERVSNVKIDPLDPQDVTASPMPTLFRLIFTLAIIAGLGYAAVYGLGTFYEPSPREITVRVQKEGFGR